MNHRFRLWLGLTLFFIYGFAFFLHDIPGVFLFFSWHQWPAYVELIAAGVVAFMFIDRARVHERMPTHHPGMGFVSGGLLIALIYVVCNLATPLFTETAAGYYAALAASNRLEILQPTFMVLITIGALQVLLTLEPLNDEVVSESEEASEVVETPSALNPDPPSMLVTMQEKAARNPTDLVTQAGLHNLLAREADPAPMLDHAKTYIAALLRQSRTEQGYELLRKCFAKDAAFKPLPETVLPLARFALALKDHKTALRVMNGFNKAHPDHVDTPHIFVQSARALIDAGERDMARKFLVALVARYPQHPAVREGKELLHSLNEGPTPA